MGNEKVIAIVASYRIFIKRRKSIPSYLNCQSNVDNYELISRSSKHRQKQNVISLHIHMYRLKLFPDC